MFKEKIERRSDFKLHLTDTKYSLCLEILLTRRSANTNYFVDIDTIIDKRESLY